LRFFKTDFDKFFKNILIKELELSEEKLKKVYSELSNADDEEKVLALNMMRYTLFSKLGKELLNDLNK